MGKQRKCIGKWQISLSLYFSSSCNKSLNISGGKICLTDHFQPLWARNVPRFGIAHALALGVSESVFFQNSIDCLFVFVCPSAWSMACCGNS